ncbi:nitrate reductase [bacterium]|nr:MAG: nitrate reductase [bacterium]
MNISSVVITTYPEYVQEVKDSISSLDFCDVHFNDPHGKIIATIEGENIHDQLAILKRIQGIRFVLSASLSYSYCEDELIKSLDEFEALKNPVPESLRDT